MKNCWTWAITSYLCRPLQKKLVLYIAMNCCLKRSKKITACAVAPQGLKLKHVNMPKVKTNSSAKKRFKVTATGKITHQKSFKRHILTKKSKKRKRALGKDGLVSKSHMNFVKRLLRLK